MTKSLLFEGGELVDGLMPDTTTQGVSLVLGPTGTLEPGASTSLLFDVVPGSADTQHALIQFTDANSHIQVLLDGSAGAADGGKGGGAGADGGMTDPAAPRRIELDYEVKKTVCAMLCDRVYELGLLQAVRLADDDVSKRAKTTLRLDCTDDGDRAQCGKADEEAAQNAPNGGDRDAAARTDASADAATGDVVRGDSGTPGMNDAGKGDLMTDAGASLGEDAAVAAPMGVTGVWVSDYDCGGGNAYWVVWKITGSGSSYTITDGFKTYDGTLTNSHMVVTLGDPDAGGTSGYLDFTADGHFSGELNEGGTTCTETGRRAPGLDVGGSGPTCKPGGPVNLPSCTPICDASTTCGVPVCTCTDALAACPDELTVWQNCLDAEGIDTPAFVCPAFEPSSCWAEWDICVVGASCF